VQFEDRPALVSEEDFLALPESTDRLELLDGEVHMAPSPSPLHQIVLGRLYRVLAAWADAHPPAFAGLAPLDVRLAPGRIVQPDLFLVNGGIDPTRSPIDVVPDLVVEVLSGNRAHDRITKRLIYAQAKVREYWIVDPLDRSIERCEGTETSEIRRDRLDARVSEGLSVEIEPLFR
jgi:Uma2 family endonuclease